MLQLDSSALWGIIGLFGGILGTMFFHIIDKKKRVLSYSIDTVSLVTKKISKIPDLEITFKGKKIENLSSSTIRIGNSGNELIEASDFASLSPLRIEVESGEFFITEESMKATMESQNQNIDLKVEYKDGALEIVFEYLNPKSEFEFTIWHTGDLKVCGDLKNGKLKREAMKNSIRANRIIKSVLTITVATLIYMLCVILMSGRTPGTPQEIMSFIVILVEVVLSCLLGIALVRLLDFFEEKE